MAITAATGSSRRQTPGGSVNRSYSQSGGRFSLSPYQSSTTNGFASSSSSFATRSSTFFAGNEIRSASPPRVSMSGQSMSASAVRFSLDGSVSPNRSISTVSPSRSRTQVVRKQPGPKKTCMCSPTNHPGSFRCSLHKNQNAPAHAPNNRLNARRSAMTNSLVRICGVEGDLVKRALAALIRPSSHQQRRRAGFQSRPSRLRSMSKVES
ncbi:unnamed protein product [Linum trigynum]|uniref:Serine-rich protein-like protein n=1 Tax=Linum trigynum TaxID=586398 RepID=A0AAV2GXC6_9ROSI